LTLALDIILCFTIILCLFPLSFYVCWLASVNRRQQPTIVSGLWDTMRVLGGVSGFILVGGVLCLNLVQSDSRLVTRGNMKLLGEAIAAQRVMWIVTLAAYLTIVAIASAVAIRLSLRSVSIYNVATSHLEAAIEMAIERAGLKAERSGNSWFTGPDRLIEIRGPHVARHMTVRFVAEKQREREELERQLRNAMVDVTSLENPDAAWFVSFGGGSVIMLLALVLLTSYLIFVK